MSQFIDVPAIRGEVWGSDALDRPATVCCCRLDDGRYHSTTVPQAIALVAGSRYAGAVDFASARIETGREGVRLVRFDLWR